MVPVPHANPLYHLKKMVDVIARWTTARPALRQKHAMSAMEVTLSILIDGAKYAHSFIITQTRVASKISTHAGKPK